MILEQIVAATKEKVASRKKLYGPAEVRRNALQKTLRRDFLAALSSPRSKGSRIIAEIKKASPSRGTIRAHYDPREIGALYEGAGAAAISIVTEQKFFQGDPGHLALVREVTSLPLLCKDFILDPYQIYEAARGGADAVLLIAAVLSPLQCEEYLEITKELGIAALVEVHGEAELEEVLGTSAGIIGINNRDLTTFRVDLDTTRRLLPLVPAGKVVVSESGIFRRSDLQLLEAAGAKAFLIGEALMSASDPAKALWTLQGKGDDQD